MVINNDDFDIQLITYKQLRPVIDTVKELIDTMPEKALNQLLDAYEGDVSTMIDEFLRQTHYVFNHNASKIDSEKLGYSSELESAFDNVLKKYSLNYFAATVPSNFTHGWRTLEWGNLLQLNPWSAYLCQRGAGKCQHPDTEVVMFDGSLKKSKDIKVGDLDLSYNVITGEIEYKKVLSTFKREARELFVIKFSNGNLIRCTEEHPIATDQGWIPAQCIETIEARDDHVGLSCQRGHNQCQKNQTTSRSS
jgi:hypothetical protein